jgi:hypothetical protein
MNPHPLNPIVDESTTILPLDPKRLISLWDMIVILGGDTHRILFQLDNHVRKLRDSGDSWLRGENVESLSKILNEAIKLSAALDLKETLGRCEHLQAPLTQALGGYLGALKIMSPVEVRTEIEGIRSSLGKEIDKKQLAFVPDGRTKYFEQAALFGELANKMIPDAAEDIRQAGNCMAFELNTAAVFHLMRVTEFGLRALAVSLGVTKIGVRELEFQTWSAIIEEINPKIETKLKSLNKVSIDRTEDEARARYRGLLKDFQYLKDSERNPFFHVRKHYDGNTPETEGVYLHIQEFMRRLAEIISGK